MFFFEKKNQKTFHSFALCQPGQARRKGMKSLFSFFSSEKEDSSFLLEATPCPP
jgi:hypothetical protein